jgi:hypothetical protein
MGMSLEDAQALATYFSENVEEFKPIVSGFLDAIGEFEPEINRVLNSVTDSMVDSKARAIKRFMEVHGFSKEEAIQITLRMESEMYTTLKSKKK